MYNIAHGSNTFYCEDWMAGGLICHIQCSKCRDLLTPKSSDNEPEEEFLTEGQKKKYYENVKKQISRSSDPAPVEVVEEGDKKVHPEDFCHACGASEQGKETKDYSNINPKPTFYACLLPELTKIAIEHGYTLAIHGSMARDLDLIAVAWINDAQDHEVMIDKMLQSIAGTIYKTYYPKKDEKPYGRLSYTLSILGDWFIDLSVIPPNSQPLIQEEKKYTEEEVLKAMLYSFGYGTSYDAPHTIAITKFKEYLQSLKQP